MSISCSAMFGSTESRNASCMFNWPGLAAFRWSLVAGRWSLVAGRGIRLNLARRPQFFIIGQEAFGLKAAIAKRNIYRRAQDGCAERQDQHLPPAISIRGYSPIVTSIRFLCQNLPSRRRKAVVQWPYRQPYRRGET
jgi:hypothetical protein